MWMRVSEAGPGEGSLVGIAFWFKLSFSDSNGDRCRFVMITPSFLASLSQEHFRIHNTDALLWLLPPLFPNTTSTASISAFQCMMTEALASKGIVSSIDLHVVQA